LRRGTGDRLRSRVFLYYAAMRWRLPALSLIATLLTAGDARATIVIPPTFEALVAGASTIFVGDVIDVRSQWIATRDGRAIITRVTFKVEEVWKGAAGAITELEFMGGTVGGMTMEVVGMPQFTAGQRSVLFVSGAAKRVSPLVGFYHGRMRVEKDHSGVDRVRTYDGRPLADPAGAGASHTHSLTAAAPMRLSDLEAAVRHRMIAGRQR
jgi:hypothetical protein